MPDDLNDPEETAEPDEPLEESAEPAPSDRGIEQEETDAAAAEAGAIGGEVPEGERSLDPAERPLAEAGQGVAEGFEQAEADLIDIASHGDQHRFPDGISRTDETATDAVFGEADEEVKEDGPDSD